MKKNFPLFYPYIPKQKILKELAHTLSGRYLGQGPKVDQFEKEFGKKLGYKYPVFLNSGTAALEIAYHLLGIGPGDEVIVPVLDATCGQMGLIRRGAKIIFCDIERNSLNLDPVDLEKKISKRTKAIVAVHLGGIAVNKKIYQIAKKKSIPVIVDLAQDLRPCAFGDYLVYSFQAIKHITTADGGMLVLRNKADYKRAKKLRWFGIDRERKNRNTWQKRDMTFDIEEAGYKFQPTDIDASFGLAGLPGLDYVLDYRGELAKAYRQGLSKTPEIKIVSGGSNLLFCLLAEKRNQLAEYLTKFGIETNLIHLRNDLYKIFGGKRLKLPNMDFVEKRYLCLPINPKITISDVKFISVKIREFYKLDSKSKK